MSDRNRANHYGSQPISSVRGLEQALKDKQPADPKLTALATAPLSPVAEDQIPVFSPKFGVDYRKVGIGPKDILDRQSADKLYGGSDWGGGGMKTSSLRGTAGRTIQFDGAGIAAERQDYVDPTNFGISEGNSGEENSDALDELMDLIRARGVPGFLSRAVERIRFPNGEFDFARSIELTDGTWILEGGSPPSDDSGTALRFPAGENGIIVQRHNTEGATGVRTSSEGGDYSIIRHLRLVGSYTDADAEAHGILLRARALIDDCIISDFEGDGIHIFAAAGFGDGSEGNANCFRVRNVRVIRSRHGFYVNGPDANAGTVEGCDADTNRGWGFWDSSFLGNTYVACHSSGNDLGAYKTDDENARNVFVGCYSESGQPASSFVMPTLVLGGIHAAGTGSYAGYIEVQGAGPWTAGGWACGGNVDFNGANHTIGPKSGAASDAILNIDFNNFRGDLNFRKWTDGTPSNVGFVAGRYGWGIDYNVTDSGWRHMFQVAGSDIAKVDTSGIELQAGKTLRVNGNQVVGARQAAIANHASDATVNAILAALRAHGLIAP